MPGLIYLFSIPKELFSFAKEFPEFLLGTKTVAKRVNSITDKIPKGRKLIGVEMIDKHSPGKAFDPFN